MFSSEPITGVVGPNGAGKTAVAVTYLVGAMDAGIPVLSTIPVTSPGGHSAQVIEHLRDIMDFRDGIIFLDEVASIFSSREWASVPPAVATRLQSLRHYNVQVIWTAPAWTRADSILREVTRVRVSVRGFFHRRRDGGLWPSPRLLQIRWEDPSLESDVRALRRRWVRLGALRGLGCYDSRAPIAPIGSRVEAGACIDCGGSRPRPRCTCSS